MLFGTLIGLSIESKIMLAGFIVLAGFLWSYLFLRQICFNFIIAYPMIRKMNSIQDDLIAVGAKRYTNVSVVATSIIGGIFLALAIWLCLRPGRYYLLISFIGGAVTALVLFLLRMSPSNKEVFDLFAGAYYRFVPDDELRTILANKEYKKIRPRLHDMGISGTFIPEFKK
ncbi:MAG: hypothetical protein IK095_06110 [Oscillospiraceae bacterium]|nr:hypothetical protein [Oscillospiraceae bacterium]